MKKQIQMLLAAAVTAQIPAWAQGVSVVPAAYPGLSTPAPSEQSLPFAPPPVATRAVPAPATSSPSTWKISSDDIRLATTLDRWAKQAGFKLIWDAQKHVLLSSADSFTGTFEEALTRVLSSPAIRRSDYPLEACIYPNNPPVVRITKLGDQNTDCPQ
jgi:hypothetical protein